MNHGSLPEGLALVRTTDVFDRETVPTGLLRAHRVAAGTWGVVRVLDGSLTFVWEDVEGPASRVVLAAGDSLVIPPDTPHRVELGDGCRFVVDFLR